MLSCWDGSFQLPGAASSHYYKLHSSVSALLNGSALALDMSSISTTAKKHINSIMSFGVGLGLSAYAASEIYHAATGGETSPMLRAFALQYIGTTVMGSTGAIGLALNYPPLNVAISATASASSVLSAPDSYAWTRADFQVFPLMRQKICLIASYYQAMKNIYLFLQDTPELRLSIDHFDDLRDFFENPHPDTERLCSLLNSFSFKNPDSYLFRPGEVLLAWEMLHSGSTIGKKQPPKKEKPDEIMPGDHVRADFAKALVAIGQVNMLLFKTNLTCDSKPEQPISIPQMDYDSSPTPQIQLKEMWHPLIPDCVANSVSLGHGHASRGMIITGPHENGKSSAAKALALSVAMAPNGLLFAESGRLSHFSYVGTSMNISDSIAKKQSGYKAQCDRLVELRDASIGHSKAQSLIVFDEIVVQTEIETGAHIIETMMQDSIATEGVIPVVITHFRDIAKTFEGRLTADFCKKDRGSLQLAYANMQVKNYRLYDGVSSEYNGMAMAQKAGLLSGPAHEQPLQFVEQSAEVTGSSGSDMSMRRNNPKK